MDRRVGLGVTAAVLSLAGAAVLWQRQRVVDSGEEPVVGTPYAVLERQLERNPRDVRVRVFKARADSLAGRHAMAVAGYRRALEDSPKVARDPGVWVELAEAIALAQGGTLAGEPRALVDKALALNPGHAAALDLAGSAAWEAGDFPSAVRHWQRLSQQLKPDDPRSAELERAIAQAQRRSSLSLPPPR